jgi:hypothetical protein
MKQSMRASRRQLALWFERGDRFRPSEEMREEVTRALADLLLEALGAKVLEAASQSGGGDESEDHA